MVIGQPLGIQPPQEFTTPKHIDLEISDDDLIEISEQGLLALNLEEMQAIQSHYRNDEIRKSRNSVGIVADKPTDVQMGMFSTNLERTL